jgi:Cu(I)/Ag(I) efflux system membrane fusion protein/cobalt-zinc-cadmium efflux system membrane fusion protein
MTDKKQDHPKKAGLLWRALDAVRSRLHRSESVRNALRLPPMSRGIRRFSFIAFFVLGVAVTWFVVGNPLGLGFLPSVSVDSQASSPAEEGGERLYQCPMHPEVIESTEGTCPICNMALVEIKGGPATTHASSGRPEASGERKVLYWYAPMDPTYMRDEPGLSPMGMKLVPKYAEDVESSEAGVIRIDPVQVQNIGVVSTEALAEDIARYSRTVGILDFNADHINWVNTKFEGWIEKVHVNYVGQDVRQGQPLFAIYSPELVTTQEEYLRALEYRASLIDSGRTETLRQAESLVRSSRERLEYWDITEQQIRHLESTRQVQRRLTVTSPADGVVVELMNEALEGMFVKPGMDLYKIANLSTVWVHADVYESDMAWIRDGQDAVVSFRHDPGREVRGKILFLYPEVSRDTRTLKICIEVANPDGHLRPGMYADVLVEGPALRKAVVVPRAAVLRSGERDIVFLDLGDGRFQPREVSLGVAGQQDRVQILAGVSPGDRVVTQAQFMLDSESRIQEAIAKFMQRGASGSDASNAPPTDSHVH